MAHYTFSIDNRSREPSSYAIFAHPPLIQGLGRSKLEADLSTPIILSVHQVPNPHGQVTIMLPKSYYATCGIYDIASEPASSDLGRSRSVSGTAVIDYREVKLGTVTAAVEKVAGTTLEVSCSTGTPRFTAASQTRTATGEPGCFALLTGSGFTYEAAKSNKYFIGFTSSMRHNIGPYAMFVPQPNQVYQIAPSAVFYVTAVSAGEPRGSVEPTLWEKTKCKVDFAALAREHVHVVHGQDGSLAIAADSQGGGVNRLELNGDKGAATPDVVSKVRKLEDWPDL